MRREEVENMREIIKYQEQKIRDITERYGNSNITQLLVVNNLSINIQSGNNAHNFKVSYQ
jgi:hypothetical protein